MHLSTLILVASGLASASAANLALNSESCQAIPGNIKTYVDGLPSHVNKEKLTEDLRNTLLNCKFRVSPGGIGPPAVEVYDCPEVSSWNLPFIGYKLIIRLRCSSTSG
jgi:hypothetical protein